MKIHTVTERASRPRHTAGEIIWASVGNYIAAGHGLPNNGRPARFKRGKPTRGF